MRKVLYFFGHFLDADMEWIARHGKRRHVRKDEVIITQGKSLGELFIVLSGKISIRASASLEFATVGGGDILGEMSLIESRAPVATAVAVEPGEVLALDFLVLRAHLNSDPGFAARFYLAIAMFLSDRMRSTVTTISQSAAGATTSANDDELDESILEGLNLAGLRFNRLLNSTGS